MKKLVSSVRITLLVAALALVLFSYSSCDEDEGITNIQPPPPGYKFDEVKNISSSEGQDVEFGYDGEGKLSRVAIDKTNEMTIVREEDLIKELKYPSTEAAYKYAYDQQFLLTTIQYDLNNFVLERLYNRAPDGSVLEIIAKTIIRENNGTLIEEPTYEITEITHTADGFTGVLENFVGGEVFRTYDVEVFYSETPNNLKDFLPWNSFNEFTDYINNMSKIATNLVREIRLTNRETEDVITYTFENTTDLEERLTKQLITSTEGPAEGWSYEIIYY